MARFKRGATLKEPVEAVAGADAVRRSTANLSGEFERFVSFAQRGPAYVQAAGREFELSLGAAIGSRPAILANPLPHRVSPRQIGSGRLAALYGAVEFDTVQLRDGVPAISEIRTLFDPGRHCGVTHG